MEELNKYIELKNLGAVKQVLGMQPTQKRGKIFISQKKYIEDLLDIYGMDDSNKVNSPIDIN